MSICFLFISLLYWNFLFFSFASSMCVTAHWSISMMVALKFLADNSDICIISVLVSIGCFSSFNLVYSWLLDIYPIYKTLNLIYILCLSGCFWPCSVEVTTSLQLCQGGSPDLPPHLCWHLGQERLLFPVDWAGSSGSPLCTLSSHSDWGRTGTLLLLLVWSPLTGGGDLISTEWWWNS